MCDKTVKEQDSVDSDSDAEFEAWRILQRQKQLKRVTPPDLHLMSVFDSDEKMRKRQILMEKAGNEFDKQMELKRDCSRINGCRPGKTYKKIPGLNWK